MSTTEASEPVAAGLGVAPGSRVKMLDRVVSTVDGQPVEWRVAYTREDRTE
jgi:DNA-binding GntR family transcriptional regulator